VKSFLALLILPQCVLMGVGCAPPSSGPSRASPFQPLPAISGGTLLVTRDGLHAVAADAARDGVWVVDLAQWAVRGQVSLEPGEEPGRLVEGEAGQVYALTRRGGELLQVDVEQVRLMERRRVCSAPRGLAYEMAGKLLHVACGGGELVTLPAGGGGPVRVLRLRPGLRDVVPEGEGLWISSFQSAEVMRMSSSGILLSRFLPPAMSTGGSAEAMEPAVGWRLVADPAGGVALLHQLAFSGEVRLTQQPQARPPYAGPSSTPEGQCGQGLVHGAITTLGPSGAQARDWQVALGVLPGDVAFSGSGSHLAAVSSGSRRVVVGTRAWLEGSAGRCAPLAERSFELPDQPVAVAFTPGGELLVQTVDGWGLTRLLGHGYERLTLGEAPSFESVVGARRFHEPSPSHVSCASCHPEGGQDGRTWRFDTTGPRRTQPLQGGISAMAPFHWDGSVPDLRTLLVETLVNRMGGTPPSEPEVSALGAWLDTLPLEPPLQPRAAEVAHGRALFESPMLGCTRCHTGPRLASSTLVDVGTGGAFKAPSLLRLATRAPYLHDGRAATLTQVLGPTGGSVHDVGFLLAPAERAELEAYLESL